MVARPIVVRNNFQEGFGHYRIKIRHLKGEKSVIKFGLLIPFTHLKSSSYKEGTKTLESTMG